MYQANNNISIFSSPIEFSLHVEKTAAKEKQTVLDTLLKIVDEYDIEMDDVKSLLSESLIQKLRKEYENLGLLPKTKVNTVDFF